MVDIVVSPTVTVETKLSNTVSTTAVETISVEVPSNNTVVSTPSDNTVTNSEVYNVVIEVPSSTTIISGQAGPVGATGLSEDSVAYARQTDFATDSLIYKGEAEAGTAFSSASWRIRKIIISDDGDISETWADGNANFDNVWNDRASLSYV